MPMAPTPARILTQQQQMSTMRRACSTPAVPTIQVSRKNRITPKIFCRQGRYTPMRVPMLGAYGTGREEGSTEHQRGPDAPWKASPWSLRRLLIPGVFYQRIGWNPECSPGEHGEWGDS